MMPAEPLVGSQPARYKVRCTVIEPTALGYVSLATLRERPKVCYASVFYSYFAALGYEITVEESSSRGRLDMAVRTGGHVYLFEFKVVEMAPPGSALA